MENNIAYKWRRILVSKAYGGKVITLSPVEAQELIDDIERGKPESKIFFASTKDREEFSKAGKEFQKNMNKSMYEHLTTKKENDETK